MAVSSLWTALSLLNLGCMLVYLLQVETHYSWVALALRSVSVLYSSNARLLRTSGLSQRIKGTLDVSS